MVIGKVCSMVHVHQTARSPVVHGLGEPAQHRVPVGQVGLLLGDVSLAVGQHVRQVFHKVVGLLFQDLLIQVAQVNQVPYDGGQTRSHT